MSYFRDMLIITAIITAWAIFMITSFTISNRDDKEMAPAYIAEKITECRNLGGNPVIEAYKSGERYKECVLPKEGK